MKITILLLLILQAAACAKGTQTFTLEVSHGQTVQRESGSGLIFRLAADRDPFTPGWTIEVRPKGETDPEVELSWPVNPPYRGWNSRRLDVSYDVTAAQSLEMKTREFFFLRNPQDYARTAEAVRSLLWSYGISQEKLDESRKLLDEVPKCAATVRIVDAKLGKHSAAPPAPAERIEWLKVEVELCTPVPPPEVYTPALWGQATDGLQLSVTTGVNTTQLTETQSLLYLTVQVRNAADSAVSVDLTSATYSFEYEIDGKWYAFPRFDPASTPYSVMLADPNYAAVRSTQHTIAPGSMNWTVLTVPLAGRSPSLQLFAITPSGPGTLFEPTRREHVIRVRPGRALDSTRRAPVSNAVTVLLGAPTQIDRSSQLVTFNPSPDTLLRELQFVSGPPNAEQFIRGVLARPENPARVHALITAAALEVLKPIARYEFWVTGRNSLPMASLPTPTNGYVYAVRPLVGDPGYIYLESRPTGLVQHSFYSPQGNDDQLLRTLQQLAQMDQVRGGSYEPRLVEIIGIRGASAFPVFWLYSATGRPDLFYRERDPWYRGYTSVDSEKLYTAQEFLTAARTLPVAPRYNEAWAIGIASACAKAEWPSTGNPLNYEEPVVEVGLRGPTTQERRLGWYVHFPERENAQQLRSKHSGATFFVEEDTGACAAVGH